MEKAYDLSNLVSRLKSKGLHLGEEALKVITVETLDWVAESAKISPNPIDDFACLIIPKVKEILVKLEDKLDGQEE